MTLWNKFSVLWALILFELYIVVYLIPQQSELFSLAYDRVISGEYFRLLTYQFSHVDLDHLVSNLGGFVFLAIIICEVNIDSSDFYLTYLLTGFLAAIPIWFYFKDTLLGASVAIYGGYSVAAMSLESYGLSPIRNTLLVVFLIFVKPIVHYFEYGLNGSVVSELMTSMYHMNGFVIGAFIFLMVRWLHEELTHSHSILTIAMEE